MPLKKDNLSTTASTRLLAALPSKVYLAMYQIYGSDNEARKKINNLARALVLDYFFSTLNGDKFLTEDEAELLESMREIESVDLGSEDWATLVEQFKSRGNGDPSSPAYIVHTLADLDFAVARAE